MNVWMIVAIGIVAALIMLKILHMILAHRFDTDWEKMSRDERWKLQNEARKKNV